jgi:hypothetical protein
MLKMVKERHEREDKMKVLSGDLKKLNRRYDNLVKESAAK